jgi:hypothetical protein
VSYRFLYRPSARDADAINGFPKVSQALFKGLTRFSFEDLRRTFLTIVAEGKRTASLAHAEQLIASLSDRPDMPRDAIDAVAEPLCANVRETPENCLIREEGEKVSMNVDVSERYGKS